MNKEIKESNTNQSVTAGQNVQAQLRAENPAANEVKAATEGELAAASGSPLRAISLSQQHLKESNEFHPQHQTPSLRIDISREDVLGKIPSKLNLLIFGIRAFCRQLRHRFWRRRTDFCTRIRMYKRYGKTYYRQDVPGGLVTLVRKDGSEV